MRQGWQIGSSGKAPVNQARGLEVKLQFENKTKN
jgi:hypothetical protein